MGRNKAEGRGNRNPEDIIYIPTLLFCEGRDREVSY